MSKLSNVLLMLQYLENGRKYNIKELAEKLEVSERMVRVYKEELEKAGIYIDTIKGPYGGYVLNQSVHIPTRKFRLEDYEFLKSIKVPDSQKDQMELLVDKIHSIYSESKDEKIELKDEQKNYYNAFTRAIKEHKKVRINYYSFVHGYQDRVIHPLDLFYYHSGWGCAAYCELKKDLRHFELKRIRTLQMLDETF